MEDDSPVFSLVILGKDKWDKVIGANDLIRIKVIPDVKEGEPDNPYIMVGLISDVHKEGEYDKGTLLYRITGMAMAKALIDFEVGVIQEVATIIPNIGWLPDGTEDGLHFSGNSAAGIGNELMNRFVYKYAQYDFTKDRDLETFFIHRFTSWKDESLADVTPFINYQGSIRQFLEDVSAKPFNELFFEYTSKGKCVAIMRPTPFDPDKWSELPLYRFTSDSVVEESFGKSDSEMYSVYVVQAPNLMEFTSMDLGVFPKYSSKLLRKYGYKRLNAQNRYLLSSEVIGKPSSGEGRIEEALPPQFEDVLKFLTKNNYTKPEVVRKQRNKIYSDMAASFPTMSDSLMNNVLDSLKAGNFTREAYNQMVKTSGDSKADKKVNKEKHAASAKLEEYTQRLFNWYCENANFYNGDIRVLGYPSYRVGSRVLYEDFEQDTTWEFYVESVQHEFSFTNGYTTILGVTRGLPDSGTDRFSNLWGKSEDFKGGYLGEHSLEELLKEAQQARSSGNVNHPGGWGNGAPSSVAAGVVNSARNLLHVNSIYDFGGGRSGKNPFLSVPVRVDCSSFVWWLFWTNGVTLKGGKTGMTTDTIKNDPQLTTVGYHGESKWAVQSRMRIGDIVYFDTYKVDGHMGIYIGDGQFIGAQGSSGISKEDMNNSYWWSHFKGHVMRYTG